jgi:hypothetical protein
MSPYNVGDFEAGNAFAVPNAESSTEIVIPEINIQLQSQAIVAKTKKLKAVWTPEFAQDLMLTKLLTLKLRLQTS